MLMQVLYRQRFQIKSFLKNNLIHYITLFGSFKLLSWKLSAILVSYICCFIPSKYLIKYFFLDLPIWRPFPWMPSSGVVIVRRRRVALLVVRVVTRSAAVRSESWKRIFFKFNYYFFLVIRVSRQIKRHIVHIILAWLLILIRTLESRQNMQTGCRLVFFFIQLFLYSFCKISFGQNRSKNL